MRKSRFDVPTVVLVDQGRTIYRQLITVANKPRLKLLETFGIDGGFAGRVGQVVEELATLDAEQERAKAAYTKEAKEDQALAEKGYRFKLKLDARVRAYMAAHDDDDNLAGRFRFGQLRVARARGVLNELRIVLPEAMALSSKLQGFGVTDAFLAEGQEIVVGLGGASESAAAKQAREKLTQQVREKELELGQLLDRLRQADEAVALDDPAEAPVFRLDLIKAEVRRVKAAREARLAARVSATDDPED
jgi:hypothetical protein